MENSNSFEEEKPVIIIGPYPPPYGGISVHIQRMVNFLDDMNFNYIFFSETFVGKRNNFMRFDKVYYKFIGVLYIFFYSSKLIHYHSPNSLGRVFVSFLGFLGKDVFIHVHGASLKDTLAKKSLASYIISKLGRYCNYIVDNPNIAEVAKQINARNIYEIDAFLPKETEKKTSLIQIKNRKNFDLVVSMVGWFTEYNGADLYGFDILCKAIKNLEKDIKIHAICSVNGIQSNEIHENFLSIQKKLNIKENFTLLYKQLEDINSLFISSDLFVRPSLSDGSSLSVKEALWLDKPVIASDCVIRENSVITYKTGSALDLSSKIIDFYRNNKKEDFTADKIEKIMLKEFNNRIFDEIYNTR